MCDPVTATAITAAALQAGGTAIQTQNNNKVANNEYKAKQAVVQQGIQQQKLNQQDANAALNTTLDTFQPAQQSQSLGNLISNRTNAIQANSTPAPANDPTNNIGNAPQVVKDTIADKMAQAAAFGKQQAGALGAIGGTNDQMLSNTLNTNDAGRKIGTISDFAKNQARVNTAQQTEAVQNARRSANPIGSLIAGAGSALSLGTGAAGGIGKLISGPDALSNMGVFGGAGNPLDLSSGSVWTPDDKIKLMGAFANG